MVIAEIFTDKFAQISILKNLDYWFYSSVYNGYFSFATDSTESMSFKVEYGNNMHINPEPDSGEEPKKLYDALSKGGKITRELQDMFRGAYFGTCTAKYGINWVFNFIEK